MRILISFLAGFAMLLPLGWIFGVMNWPLFHSWGLAHGSFMLAWPVLWLIAYLLLGLFEPKTKRSA
jgi:hypothetical protein